MKRTQDSGTITLASRLAGAAWGHLVGDAVGVPYEFRSAAGVGGPDAVRLGEAGTHGQPPGTWSDDGALMLALLDSLLEAGFDPGDQARRALAWRRDGAYTPDGDGLFDIGGATATALHALERGAPAVDAGPAGEHACGNGSLMRILPLALWGRDLPAADLAGRAHLASRVTHGHARCQVACAVYCLVVQRLVHGEGRAGVLDAALADARSLYRSDGALTAHLAALDELEGWPAREGSGYVLDSLWSAWDAFAGATGFEDTVRRAVAYGRDTDTTAAIAGGLAGAWLGWQGIPLEWRRAMRGREVATPLVDRLVGTTGARTSTASPLRVDPLDLSGIDVLDGGGRAGITFLPGKKRDGWTGPHWRDLDLDLASLRGLGVDALFLLVEDVELDRCLVSELPEVMRDGGPEPVRFPIPDAQVPRDARAFRAAVRDLVGRVGRGRSVAIACRGGIDRSGMAAACLLREAGLGAGEAIARVQAARRGSITIRDQQDLVRAWPTR